MKMPRLIPQTHQFNDLLEKLTAEACAAAKNLQNFVKAANDDDRARAALAIEATRANSKNLSIGITEELCRSFITPFDREDIHDLSEILYKIPKTVEKIKDRILLHKLFGQPNDFAPQADIIAAEAGVLQDIMTSLLRGENNKQVREKIAALRDLENDGDDIRNELLTALFSRPCDIRELLLRRDIHDMLEKVVDRFRDAANVAFQVVLKHS
jgi:uncharacterized protein